MADLAFAAGLHDAPERAGYVLHRHARSTAPSVVGRRLGLAILAGTANDLSRQLFARPVPDRWFALVGLARMLGPQPTLESNVWSSLSKAIHEPRQGRPSWILCVFVAGRILVLERAYGDDSPSRSKLLSCVLSGVDKDGLVRTLEGTLRAYAKDPTGVVPKLLPYQVISIYEALVAAGRRAPGLDQSLASALLTVLDGPADIERMHAWAPKSGVARLVDEHLQGESPEDVAGPADTARESTGH